MKTSIFWFHECLRNFRADFQPSCYQNQTKLDLRIVNSGRRVFFLRRRAPFASKKVAGEPETAIASYTIAYRVIQDAANGRIFSVKRWNLSLSNPDHPWDWNSYIYLSIINGVNMTATRARTVL